MLFVRTVKQSLILSMGRWNNVECCLWDSRGVLTVVCGTVEQSLILSMGRWKSVEIWLSDGEAVLDISCGTVLNIVCGRVE